MCSHDDVTLGMIAVDLQIVQFVPSMVTFCLVSLPFLPIMFPVAERNVNKTSGVKDIT